MIHYLPIEHIEQRYTAHMDNAIRQALLEMDVPVRRYYPDVEQRPIKDGSFLDAPTTIEFKAKQIAMLADAFHRGTVENGDIVFCSDLWMPGILSVPYMAHFTNRHVRLRGILHAGSWTDTDHVRSMERWAHSFEEAVLDVVDKVFVASLFACQELCTRRKVWGDKVEVIPFVLDERAAKARREKRDPLVVFNGRNDREKQPWLFNDLKARLRSMGHHDVEFVATHEHNFSKDEYHALLGRASVVVSFALQENFGFGINEAVLAGCVPVVPNRLVYPEFYHPRYRYNTQDECADLVLMALDGRLPVPDPVGATVEDLKLYFA